MMVGCGLMRVGSTVGVDVDDSGQRNLEGVVEFMLDPLSRLVSSGHRHLGINRDRGGHMVRSRTRGEGRSDGARAEPV